jgi:hypothetical protein
MDAEIAKSAERRTATKGMKPLMDANSTAQAQRNRQKDGGRKIFDEMSNSDRSNCRGSQRAQRR